MYKRQIQSEHTLDSNAVFGLQHVPKTLAIIGGGYIGLEFACFFQEIGTQVSVFEMLPQIAAGADGEISARMLQIDVYKRQLFTRFYRFSV